MLLIVCLNDKTASGSNDACKSPETAIKKITRRASKSVVSDTLCIIEESNRERERENDYHIYIIY